MLSLWQVIIFAFLYVVFVAGVEIDDADVEDGGYGSVDCYNYNSRDTPSTVAWTLTTDSGQTLDLGTCIAVNNCTSTHSPSIILRRRHNDSSTVDFSRVNRTLQGLLSCSFTYGGITETDTKPLNFYHTPTVENCSVEISRHNWSFILSCNITDAFSSIGTYEFDLWQEATPSRKYLFSGNLPFRDGLTSYVKTSDNKVYYNGTLTYSWHLPAIPYKYTEFRVYAYCSSHSFNFLYLYTNINITPPSQPTHNCSELNYIPETGVVPCVCTAGYLGSPTGRLIWLIGNTTIATGDYGVTKLKFPSGKVSRQHDGMMAMCQLDWVQPRITAITRNVAYGPDNVTLQITQTNDSNIMLVHVTSHVTNMNPIRAEMVRWGGECAYKKGFTCTLTLSAATNVNVKDVTCRVTNTANNGHSAEASIVRINEKLTGTGDTLTSVATSKPNPPTHNCSDLNFIPETGVVPCVCTSDDLVSPTGRLVWLLGNIIIATGKYGVSQLKFPSGKMNRQHDGMIASCQLDLPQPINTVFTSHVAYGPDSMTLHVTQYRDTSGNLLIHVTSNVIRMKPINADMVQWGGECQGQQGFTCYLTPRSDAEVDGKAVTCRVTNAANNGHSADASVLIKISGRQGALHSGTKREPFNWTAIGVGIALSIVVIVLVVLMIVLYRRGSLCKRPEQKQPQTPGGEDPHLYTSLNISGVANSRVNDVQQGVTCPPAVSQGDNRVYESIAMEGQRGHM